MDEAKKLDIIFNRICKLEGLELIIPRDEQKNLIRRAFMQQAKETFKAQADEGQFDVILQEIMAEELTSMIRDEAKNLTGAAKEAIADILRKKVEEKLARLDVSINLDGDG